MNQIKKGYVHIYTGEGKGKTTAAMGLVMRAAEYNLSILVAQLFKEKTGEARQLEKLGVKYISYSSKHPFFRKYSKKEIEDEAGKCRAFVRHVFRLMEEESYDLVVIDEMGPALHSKLFPEDELARLIRSKPVHTELVMTGRGFPDKILQLADYITDMRKVKHPYDKGVQARKGIEL